MQSNTTAIRDLSLSEALAVRDCFLATVCYQKNDYVRGDKWQTATPLDQKEWNENASSVYHYVYGMWRKDRYSYPSARFVLYFLIKHIKSLKGDS